MNAVIASFRRNRHTLSSNHMILHVSGVSDRTGAEKLVGKIVTYDTGKNKIPGKVASAHGNSGAVRVIFERGMPGQSLGRPAVIA